MIQFKSVPYKKAIMGLWKSQQPHFGFTFITWKRVRCPGKFHFWVGLYRINYGLRIILNTMIFSY